MGKITAICLGMAVGMHTYACAGFHATYVTNVDASKAVDAFTILALIMYTFAFLLSLVDATGEGDGPLARLAKPIVVSLLSIAGVVCFLIATIVIAAALDENFHDGMMYIVTILTLAAFLALVGGLKPLIENRGGYSRE